MKNLCLKDSKIYSIVEILLSREILPLNPDLLNAVKILHSALIELPTTLVRVIAPVELAIVAPR